MDPSTITIGDDYMAADARQIKWTEPSAAAWVDLTGATASMIVTDKNGNVISTIAGSVTSPAGTAVVSFDYPTAETSKLKPGKYNVRVKATKSGRFITLLNDSFVAVN